MKPREFALFLSCSSTAFIFGIFPGVFYGDQLRSYLLVFIFVLISCFFVPVGKYKMLLICIFTFYIIGFIRGRIANSVLNDYADVSGKHVEILVDSVSDSQSKAHSQVAMEFKRVGDEQNILALISANQDPQYGMRWVLSGTLHSSAEKSIKYDSVNNSDSDANFDYGGYLRSKNIYATVASPQIYLIGKSVDINIFSYFCNLILGISYKLKSFLYTNILKKYDDNTGSLLKAVLFGDKTGISKDQIQEYIKSGSIHLIAISGYKLTLLLMFLRLCFRPFFGRKVTFFINSLICLWYAMIFSFAAPILRVVFMSAIFLISELVGGGYNDRCILIFVAAFMAFCNPLSLTYDSSFLLSFLGVLGILSINPIINKYVLKKNNKFIKFISEFFFAALAAFVFTLPISVYAYGEISLIGPFSSILLMPLLSPCIILGYISALPVLGSLVAFVNKYILWYFDFVPNKLSTLKYSSINLNYSGITVYLIYLVSFLCFAYLKYRGSFAKMT